MTQQHCDILFASPPSKEQDRLCHNLRASELTYETCEFKDILQTLSLNHSFDTLIINLENNEDHTSLNAALQLSKDLRTAHKTSQLRLLLIGVNQELLPSIKEHSFNDILFGPIQLPSCLARIRAQARLITIAAEKARREQVTKTYIEANLLEEHRSELVPEYSIHTTHPTILITGRPNGYSLIEKTLSAHAVLITAHSETTVKEYLARQKFDLMIINGGRQPTRYMEMVESIRRNPACFALPILLVAHPTKLTTSHIAYQTGVTDIINAPANPLELVLRSQNLIEEQRQRASMAAAYQQPHSTPCHDGLTRLFSKSFFLSYLSHLIAESSPDASSQNSKAICKTLRPTSLLSIKIDNLNELNKKYGYQGGDLILRQCAEIIISTIRGEDLAARISGAGFGVSFPETTKEEASHVLNRLMSIMAQSKLIISPEHPPITVSMTTKLMELPVGAASDLTQSAEDYIASLLKDGPNQTTNKAA